MVISRRVVQEYLFEVKTFYQNPYIYPETAFETEDQRKARLAKTKEVVQTLKFDAV